MLLVNSLYSRKDHYNLLPYERRYAKILVVAPNYICHLSKSIISAFVPMPEFIWRDRAFKIFLRRYI